MDGTINAINCCAIYTNEAISLVLVRALDFILFVHVYCNRSRKHP